MRSRCSNFIFFFFKAEDGIRDSSVTGVQTCALPISVPRERTCPRRGGSRRRDPPLAVVRRAGAHRSAPSFVGASGRIPFDRRPHPRDHLPRRDRHRRGGSARRETPARSRLLLYRFAPDAGAGQRSLPRVLGIGAFRCAVSFSHAPCYSPPPPPPPSPRTVCRHRPWSTFSTHRRFPRSA